MYVTVKGLPINSGAVVKIIGGCDKDSIIQTGTGKVFVFDDKKNAFTTTTAKLRLSNDSDVHMFKYNWYRYNINQLLPSLFYSVEDRFYIGLEYSLRTYKW